jgi:signal transduction histidine kinase
VVEKFLQFSRAEAGLALSRERIAATQLLNDFRRREGGLWLTFARRRGAPFLVLADLDVRGIAFRNLLENAVRYGAADAPNSARPQSAEFSRVRPASRAASVSRQ